MKKIVAIFYSIALCSSISFAQDIQPPATVIPPDATTHLALIIDASASLDSRVLPDGSTLREFNLNALRSILREATDHRKNLNVILIRVCGVAEVLYMNPVTKRNYSELAEIVSGSLQGCDESSYVPDKDLTKNRPQGTDLTSGVDALTKLFSKVQNAELIFAVLSDGFNQPINLQGGVDNSFVFEGLEKFASSLHETTVVTQAVFLGIDVSIYLDYLLALNEAFANGRAYSTFDSANGLALLLQEIRESKR